MLRDFMHLLFPAYCPGCSNALSKHESVICIGCQMALPKARISGMKDNPVEKLFWGRTEIEKAAAFLQFSKGGMTQRLLHSLKYSGNQKVGEKLGRLMASELESITWNNDITCVMPVPLHPKKQKQRGFNQAHSIAMGICEIWNTPLSNNNLFRRIYNPSQTRKSRFERWKNTDRIFGVKNPGVLENQHVVLVDDVITTGSTIEACANQLKEISNMKVSVCSVACPMN